MKRGKQIEFFNVILKFDERLRLLENLVSETDMDNKVQSVFLKEKCKSCYSKIDFAQLFYILMDEGLLFFDNADEKK